MPKVPTFGQWLERKFNEKKQKNSRYSLRAFARHLGLQPGRLSELIRGQRGLSEPKIQAILKKLSVSADEQLQVQRILNAQRSLKKDFRSFGGEGKLKNVHLLSDEEFQVISDPIYYAALALLDGGIPLADYPKNLGVTEAKVRRIMNRLLKIGMIEKTKTTESYRLVHSWVATSTDQYSRAIRTHHRRKLNHAKQSIEKVPIDKRDLTSWTMCIDTDKIPEAKLLIQAFERKLTQLMTTGKQKEVYHLNIQLVPFQLGNKNNTSQ